MYDCIIYIVFLLMLNKILILYLCIYIYLSNVALNNIKEYTGAGNTVMRKKNGGVIKGIDPGLTGHQSDPYITRLRVHRIR